MPIAWRFFVMIWFDATQSDQPEVTWMPSLTGVPCGSIRRLPLELEQRCVVRRRRGVLEARDLGRSLEPVMRVLVENVVLRREAPERCERPRADGGRVRERRGIADVRPDVLRDDELQVEDRRDE